MRLPAKPYQNAIASAVQTMADRKNSFGRGKNETNIVSIQSQVRGFAVPLSDTARPEAAEALGKAQRARQFQHASKPGPITSEYQLPENQAKVASMIPHLPRRFLRQGLGDIVAVAHALIVGVARAHAVAPIIE